MNNFFHSLLTSPISPLKTSVRYFERREFIRRFGYVEKVHNRGLLPRVKEESGPLRTIPNETKPDKWRPKEALFGQNDYIDILGDGSIHPSRLMSSVPHWLRGFRGNELQMLTRKRIAYRYWKWCRPKKWTELNKRIDYLYKKLNYKTKPPKPLYPPNY